MSGHRDYYEVLGVPRDADSQTIKEAFRDLALRFHPDRNHEPGAEERFKEAAEAYAVLGDPEKRAAFDRGGFPGVAGVPPEDLFSGIDFDELFGGLGFDFGVGGGLFDRLFGAGRRGVRGGNLEVDLEIPLERVAEGGEERIEVRRPRLCPSCGGSGARAGTQPKPCGDCAGTGRRTETSARGSVRLQQVSTCPTCLGRGQRVEDPCPDCAGRGEITRDEALRVRIPAGIQDGMALRIPGKGLPTPGAGEASGDLYVIVRAAPDPRFLRRGADLWREESLSVPEAVLGTTLEVPTLDGQARVRVPPGSQSDTVLRLRGKGLPRFGGKGSGDLKVTLRLQVPEHISRKERRLYAQLRALDGKPAREG